MEGARIAFVVEQPTLKDTIISVIVKFLAYAVRKTRNNATWLMATKCSQQQPMKFKECTISSIKAVLNEEPSIASTELFTIALNWNVKESVYLGKRLIISFNGDFIVIHQFIEDEIRVQRVPVQVDFSYWMIDGILEKGWEEEQQGSEFIDLRLFDEETEDVECIEVIEKEEEWQIMKQTLISESKELKEMKESKESKELSNSKDSFETEEKSDLLAMLQKENVTREKKACIYFILYENDNSYEAPLDALIDEIVLDFALNGVLCELFLRFMEGRAYERKSKKAREVMEKLGLLKSDKASASSSPFRITSRSHVIQLLIVAVVF